MKIYDATRDFIRIDDQSKGNLFYLNPISKCLISRSEDVWLWNKRFCHINFDNLIKAR